MTCDCPDAVAWREYWTTEAIAARLHHEVDLYRRVAFERAYEAANDVRGPARVGHYPDGTPHVPLGQSVTYAELERRRREPGVWPPPPRGV